MIWQIDPKNGKDTNAGTTQSPLRSFDEYLKRCPNGIQPISQEAVCVRESAPDDIVRIADVDYVGIGDGVDMFDVSIVLVNGDKDTWKVFSSAKKHQRF